MKKFYLLSVSLTLFHPCFANVAKEAVETSQALQPKKNQTVTPQKQFPSFPIEEQNLIPAISQAPEPKPASQPKPQLDQPAPQKCESSFHKMHVGLRHSEARGVGYRHGYTTLEGFGIWDNNTDFMPFFDLRGHIFDQGKFAGNAGVGGRTFFSSINHLLGYYLYYDVRQENHGLTVQQLGPGVEMLGSRMEYRMNAYFPIVKNSHKYHYDFDRFDDHHIILKSKQKQAMTGWDAEAGRHLIQNTKYDLYAGAGPYYFTSSNASAWGGKVRLLGRFKEYVSLEATYTYDHLFGSTIQGSVGLNLPLGARIKRKDKNCSSQINLAMSRAAFAPYRFEIPVVKRVTRRSEAINPATDDPWFVWFVDNTSSSDGTFQSPFPTLVQAQNASGPNDMIYVFPGDGTSKGMNAGITLQNGQTLFGSGIHHRIKTQHGKIKIPALSDSYPLITNTGGDVVTLASGNQVSGMSINVTATAANGIAGNLIHGAKINNNIISGNVNYAGIAITSGSGDVKIKSNQLTNSFNVNASVFAAISVDVQDGQQMQANISNNVTSGFADGVDLLNLASSTTSRVDATIVGNRISNFREEGVFYSEGFANSTVNISGNTINNTVGAGTVSSPLFGGISAFLTIPSNLGTLSIQDNIILTSTTSTNVNSIVVSLSGTPAPQVTLHINNNILTTGTGAGSSGINVIANATDATVCANITNNRVTHQGTGNDIQLSAAAGSAINVDDLSGNVATNISLTGSVNLVPAGTCGEQE